MAFTHLDPGGSEYKSLAGIDHYEDADASPQEEIDSLQTFIDNGMAWQLEGSVGRACMAAIEAGQCILGEQSFTDYWGNYVPSRTEVQAGTKGSLEYALKQNCDVVSYAIRCTCWICGKDDHCARTKSMRRLRPSPAGTRSGAAEQPIS